MFQQVCDLWDRFTYFNLLIKCSGVAHEMEADDIYKGFFLPKGTRILPLEW